MNKIPVIKRFGRGDRLYVQAQQIWLILVAFVESNKEKGPNCDKTMSYGELALKMGYEDRRAGHMLSRQLGIVGQLCVNDSLPALNVIVVNAETGVPGDEVVLSPGFSVKDEQRAVFKQNWFELRVPTTGTFRQVWESPEEA
ncbi:MAG: hypothetical protein V4532_03150 [Pseudomonadota bacterium]